MICSFSMNEAMNLKGKTIVLTGATGGIGRALSRYFLSFGAKLCLSGRNEEKLLSLEARLKQEYPKAELSHLVCDLQDMDQVKKLSAKLLTLPVDLLILNAGTYAIPRALSNAGYDTVFQVNFLSHYYLVKKLLPLLEQRNAKVLVTGSIAHRFNPVDPEDPDFSHHIGDNNIYGNSKRFLMFSLMELLKNSPVEFAIGHPGINFTGITDHYPPEVLKVVKPSMLLMFMPPEQACLSILRASFTSVPYCHWVGPGYFDIWGKPVITPLHSCDPKERRQIFSLAEKMYETL